MDLTAVTPAALELRFSRAELTLLANALNALCYGLPLGPEFETLIGASRPEAEQLLEAIGKALDQSS